MLMPAWPTIVRQEHSIQRCVRPDTVFDLIFGLRLAHRHSGSGNLELLSARLTAAFPRLRTIFHDCVLFSDDRQLFIGDNVLFTADNGVFISDNGLFTADNGVFTGGNVLLTNDNEVFTSDYGVLIGGGGLLTGDEIRAPAAFFQRDRRFRLIAGSREAYFFLTTVIVTSAGYCLE